jgi:hypothetical protein
VAAPLDKVQAGVDPFASGGTLTRMDDQGAIVVEVTPVNLDPETTQVQFEVALNTHSVDLSMDLAALSTLTSDTGLRVPADVWDAPRGGHHTSGRLVFLLDQDALALLARASRLTLTVVDLDAPSRVFEWEVR